MFIFTNIIIAAFTYFTIIIKGAVSRNSAKSGYCKMPVKLKET